MSRGSSIRLATFALALLALAGCGPRGPQPIRYGEENCDRCRMTISQPRFAAELLTNTGKAYKFDSIECLAAYYEGAKDGGEVHSLWVTDYLNPGEFMPADSAVYVVEGNIPSPMGRSLLAFAPGSDTSALVRQFGGRVARWTDVIALSRTHAHAGGDR